MELRHLRYFVALADTLSFTHAAETLYVSQSTLSQQISALEDELGCKLFERNRRQTKLTSEGKALLAEAKDVLGKVDSLPAIARGGLAAPTLSESIHIGFDMRVLGSDFLKNAVTDRVMELRSDNPELHVEFQSAEYDTILHALDEGKLDLAFFLHQQPNLSRQRSAGPARLESRCLYEDELVLVVRTPEPVEDTREGLEKVLMKRGVTLLEGEGRGMLQAVRVFEELELEPQIHFVSDRNALILELNSGERAIILPKGLLGRTTSPDVQHLSFRTPAARLYVLAACQIGATNPLIAEVVGAVEKAMIPWMEIRAAELAEDHHRREITE